MYSNDQLKFYRQGFEDALGIKYHMKYQMFGMDIGKVLEIVSEHVKKENNKMATSTKYTWCEEYEVSDKEFLGWIYQRLYNIFGESISSHYMQRLDLMIDAMPGRIPDGKKKPVVIDVIDDNNVIIKRRGTIIYRD